MMTSSNANTDQRKKKQTSRFESWLANITVSWKLALIIFVLVLGTIGVFSSAFAGMQALNISNLTSGRYLLQAGGETVNFLVE